MTPTKCYALDTTLPCFDSIWHTAQIQHPSCEAEFASHVTLLNRTKSTILGLNAARYPPLKSTLGQGGPVWRPRVFFWPTAFSFYTTLALSFDTWEAAFFAVSRMTKNRSSPWPLLHKPLWISGYPSWAAGHYLEIIRTPALSRNIFALLRCWSVCVCVFFKSSSFSKLHKCSFCFGEALNRRSRKKASLPRKTGIIYLDGRKAALLVFCSIYNHKITLHITLQLGLQWGCSLLAEVALKDISCATLCWFFFLGGAVFLVARWSVFSRPTILAPALCFQDTNHTVQ